MSMFNQNISPPTFNGLVGWWRLNEGTGAIAQDSSVMGNNGTLVGSPTWVNNGKTGGGMRFTYASNNYINTTLNPSILGQQITIAAWVYPTQNTNYNGVAGGHGTVATAGLVFLQYENSAWDVAYGGGIWQTSFVSLTLNTWTHVTAVYKGGTGAANSGYIETFINGVSVNKTLQSATIVHDPNFFIGKCNVANSRTFGGIIDDVRVYNRILDSNEITLLYEYQLA